jgi:nicotinamide mononucleotide transporter
MSHWFLLFGQQLAATSLLEWFAVLLAIGYVWLAIKQNSWCWLCAFVSTAIYTWLFWQVTLPFQSVLNGYYMIMAVYGYWQWRKHSQQEVKIISLSYGYHFIIILTLGVVSIALAWLAAEQFNSDYLLVDAAINVFSIVTTFMVAHKVLQNWIYWFFINLVSAWLFAQTGLMLSACLFLGYVGFAIFGYRQWHQQWQASHV